MSLLLPPEIVSCPLTLVESSPSFTHTLVSALLSRGISFLFSSHFLFLSICRSCHLLVRPSFLSGPGVSSVTILNAEELVIPGVAGRNIAFFAPPPSSHAASEPYRPGAYQVKFKFSSGRHPLIIWSASLFFFGFSFCLVFSFFGFGRLVG